MTCIWDIFRGRLRLFRVFRVEDRFGVVGGFRISGGYLVVLFSGLF